LSFAQGWNSIYSYLISIPAEIVAAAVIVQFWVTVNNAVWITVFAALLFASNLFMVRIYGEMEFFFASLKILLIVGMNLMVCKDFSSSDQKNENRSTLEILMVHRPSWSLPGEVRRIR
jgi:amino acid permease